MGKKSNDVTIYEDIAMLKESSKNHGEKLDRLIRAMEGNGKPGLLQDIQNYRDESAKKFAEHERRFAENEAISKSARNTIIIVGIIVSIISGIAILF